MIKHLPSDILFASFDISSISPATFYLPVKNVALNPVFWTELSELNSIRSEFSDEVIGVGRVEPQNIPIAFVSEFSPFETLTESYSQSCCRRKKKKKI